MDWQIPFSPTTTSVSSQLTGDSSINRTARALFKEDASFRKQQLRPKPLGTITNIQDRGFGQEQSNTIKAPKQSLEGVAVSTSSVASVSQLKKWLVDVEKRNRTRSTAKPPRPESSNVSFTESSPAEEASSTVFSPEKVPCQNGFYSSASLSEKVVDIHKKMTARNIPVTPDRCVNIPLNKVTEMKKILMDFEKNNSNKKTANLSSKKRAVIKARLNKVADIRQWLNDMEASPSKKLMNRQQKGLDLPMNRVREMKNWLIEFEKQNKDHSKRFQKREVIQSSSCDGHARPVILNNRSSIQIDPMNNDDELSKITDTDWIETSSSGPVSELTSWLVDFERKNKEHFERSLKKSLLPGNKSLLTVESQVTKEKLDDREGTEVESIENSQTMEEEDDNCELGEDEDCDEIMNKVIGVSLDKSTSEWGDGQEETVSIQNTEKSIISHQNNSQIDTLLHLNDEYEVQSDSGAPKDNNHATTHQTSPFSSGKISRQEDMYGVSDQIEEESVVEESDIQSVIDYLREESSPMNTTQGSISGNGNYPVDRGNLDGERSGDDGFSVDDGSTNGDLLGEDLISVSQIVSQISSRSLSSRGPREPLVSHDANVSEKVVEAINVRMDKKRSKKKIKKIIGAIFDFFRQREHSKQTGPCPKGGDGELEMNKHKALKIGSDVSGDSESMELSPDSRSTNYIIDSLEGDDEVEVAFVQQNERKEIERLQIHENNQVVLRSPTMSVASAYDRALSPESSCVEIIALSGGNNDAIAIVSNTDKCISSKNVAQHVSFLQDVYGRPKGAKSVKDNYFKKHMQHYY